MRARPTPGLRVVATLVAAALTASVASAPARASRYAGARSVEADVSATAPAVAGAEAGVAGAGPDVNADGYADLVVGVPDEGDSYGAVTIALGNDKGPNPRASTLWSQSSPGVEGSGGGGFGTSNTYGDFDADGYDDVAIGVPSDSDGALDSGSVNVLYGSSAGTTVDGNQLWNQRTPGIHGEPGGVENFGADLASGDFDGDGYGDLLVALARDDMRFVPAIHLIYGSPDGLTAARSDYWKWPDRGSRGRSPYDGLALAVGDFDGNGYDDAAWGIPTHKRSQGGVHLLLGTPAGLALQPGEPLSQSLEGVAGRQHDGERFGDALAPADLNGDGFSDLAVSVPADQVEKGTSVARTVQVFFGSAVGLSTSSRRFDETDLNLTHPAGAEYDFISLTAGDLNADGFAELAVGFPLADVVTAEDAIPGAGVVVVIPGSAAGVVPAEAVTWSQQSPGVDEDSSPGDFFGDSASIADLDGDGYADLTIGVPGEDVLEFSSAGAANVVYGSPAGLTGEASELWSQAKRFVENLPSDYESFGVM